MTDDDALESHDHRSQPREQSHSLMFHETERISRRAMLRSLCTGGSVIVGVGLAGCSGTNGGGNKSPKADVSYQDHPREGNQCSGCRLFIPSDDSENGGKCSRVEGNIEPDDWCSLYSPQ